MILSFCAVCGKTEDLHQHHIVPKSVTPTMGEHKDNDETLTLCAYHHDILHQVQKKRWDTHSNMIKKGLSKRKQQGLSVGRKPTMTPELVDKIQKMINQGYGVRETLRTLKIGTKAYYFVAKNDSETINQYLEQIGNYRYEVDNSFVNLASTEIIKPRTL
jgi:hypothetical protein